MISETIRVGGVPEHFNYPWHYALENGRFASEGITVSWSEYPGGTGAMCQDLASGKLDVAVLLTEGIVKELTENPHSRILQVYVSSPLVWGIHVAAASSIQSDQELKNKKYAISRPGSGSHLMACVDASNRGFGIQENQWVTVGNLQGAIERLGKDADLFFWEKFTTKPYVDKGIFRRVGECPTPWPCFVIAVRNEVLEKRAPEILKMSEVLLKVVSEVEQDPLLVQKIAERFQLKTEDTQRWKASMQWAQNRRVEEKMLVQVQETLYSLGLIRKKVKAEELCSAWTELVK